MSGIVGTSHTKSKVIGRSQDTAIAWVQFAGASAPTVADSFGFSSLTDVGTGNYKPNFERTRSTNDYAAIASTQASSTNTGKSVAVANPATGYFSIECYENDSITDAYNCYCVVFGD